MPHVCSGGSEWPYSEQSVCSSVCPSNFTYFLSCTWSNLAHTSLTERLWVKDVHWSKSSFLVIAILIRRILDRTIHSLPLAKSYTYFTHREPFCNNCAMTLRKIYRSKIKVKSSMKIVWTKYSLPNTPVLSYTSIKEFFWVTGVQPLWAIFIGQIQRTLQMSLISRFKPLFFPLCQVLPRLKKKLPVGKGSEWPWNKSPSHFKVMTDLCKTLVRT